MLDLIDRRGSFAAAAAALGKVPSALSYQVRRLEETLDVLLFDRRGARARPTAAGRELLREGRRLLNEADDLAGRVRQLASGWEQELRIAVDATLPFDRLIPLIDDFHAQGTPTRLRIAQEVLYGGWDALIEGRADLVIGAPYDAPAAAAHSGRFGMQVMGEVRFVWCIAPSHPLATQAEPISSEVLRGYRAVAIADTSRDMPAHTTGLLVGQPLLTVASFEQKLAAQLSGLGCGYLPEVLARPYLQSGQLVSRRLAEPRARTLSRYAWRKSPAGKALAWWLGRLAVARVRQRLLSVSLPSARGANTLSGAESAARPHPGHRLQRAS
jgi:DNA-binding transcriptional LysR family regulator